MAAAWIFQANPERFDIDGYLAVNTDISWMANQHADEISVGDPVFMWRTGQDAGIIALALVVEAATTRPDDESSSPYWRAPTEASMPKKRVRLRITKVANKKQVVKREWLKSDPVCRDLPNIQSPQGTNFPVQDHHFERLAALFSRTGRDFNQHDLMTCLFVYAITYGGPVSELPDSPVAEAAVELGRSVSSIYLKTLNFRALDPRSSGAGMDQGSAGDKRIWETYWTEQGIDIERLRRDLGKTTAEADEVNPVKVAMDVDDVPPSEEGRRRLASHLQLERNAGIVRRAKAVWMTRDPNLRCEVCSLSFVEKYGERGEGFIEAHHRSPLSDGTSPVRTTIGDLAPLCANCHRMIHRQGLLSIDELRRLMRSPVPVSQYHELPTANS